MKEVKLGGMYGSKMGNYAMVDDEDYEELIKHHWSASSPTSINKTVYAIRHKRIEGKMKVIWMHKQIMKSLMQIDHIDHNSLNNQKANLRETDSSGNNANKRKTPGKYISDYMGVSRYKNGKWNASLKKNRKSYNKQCDTEIEAALAYNKMALKHHGEFANLNIIQESIEKKF